MKIIYTESMVAFAPIDKSSINTDLRMFIESIVAEKSFYNPLGLHNEIGPSHNILEGKMSLVCSRASVPFLSDSTSFHRPLRINLDSLNIQSVCEYFRPD